MHTVTDLYSIKPFHSEKVACGIRSVSTVFGGTHTGRTKRVSEHKLTIQYIFNILDFISTLFILAMPLSK